MGGRGSGAVGVSPKALTNTHTQCLVMLNGCNTVIAVSNLRRAEPFRGIATARQKQSLLAMTCYENYYKQSISTTSAEVSKREVRKPIANGQQAISGGGGEVLPIKGHHREPAAGKATYHRALMGEAARGISRSHIGNSSAGPHYTNFRTSAPIS